MLPHFVSVPGFMEAGRTVDFISDKLKERKKKNTSNNGSSPPPAEAHLNEYHFLEHAGRKSFCSVTSRQNPHFVVIHRWP